MRTAGPTSLKSFSGHGYKAWTTSSSQLQLVRVLKTPRLHHWFHCQPTPLGSEHHRNDAIAENTFALFVGMCTRTATFIVAKPNISNPCSCHWTCSQVRWLQLMQQKLSFQEHEGVLILLPHNLLMSLHSPLDRASNTVFKVDGRFYRNLESCIKLAGVNSSFRNSSVFRQYAVDKSHERRQAFLEVDAVVAPLVPSCSSFGHFKPFASYINLLWLPSDMKRTMVYILVVTTISAQYLHRFCCSLRQGPLVYTQHCDTLREHMVQI